jgi:hypothetical protein
LRLKSFQIVESLIPHRHWRGFVEKGAHSPALRLLVCLFAALSTDAISRWQGTRVARLVTKPRGFRGAGLT